MLGPPWWRRSLAHYTRPDGIGPLWFAAPLARQTQLSFPPSRFSEGPVFGPGLFLCVRNSLRISVPLTTCWRRRGSQLGCYWYASGNSWRWHSPIGRERLWVAFNWLRAP